MAKKWYLSIILALLVPSIARATTTVSGKLLTPAEAAVASNAYIRLEIKNYGKNLPRILGTNTILPSFADIYPDGTGAVTTTLTGNELINPGNTWYRATYFRGGTKFYECDFYVPSLLVGTVNTSGTTVTWVSGSKFPYYTAVDGKHYSFDWVGSTITINSVPYTILSVDSTTTLTLSTSAGVQSGVAFSHGANTLNLDSVNCLGTLPPSAIPFEACTTCPPGADGADGVAGATGATGTTGATGATGPAGAAGVCGCDDSAAPSSPISSEIHACELDTEAARAISPTFCCGDLYESYALKTYTAIDLTQPVPLIRYTSNIEIHLAADDFESCVSAGNDFTFGMYLRFPDLTNIRIFLGLAEAVGDAQWGADDDFFASIGGVVKVATFRYSPVTGGDTNWKCLVNSTSPSADSGVAPTTGWHKYEIAYDVATTTTTFKIDHVDVCSVAGSLGPASVSGGILAPFNNINSTDAADTYLDFGLWHFQRTLVQGP